MQVHSFEAGWFTNAQRFSLTYRWTIPRPATK